MWSYWNFNWFFFQLFSLGGRRRTRQRCAALCVGKRTSHCAGRCDHQGFGQARLCIQLTRDVRLSQLYWIQWILHCCIHNEPMNKLYWPMANRLDNYPSIIIRWCDWKWRRFDWEMWIYWRLLNQNLNQKSSLSEERLFVCLSKAKAFFNKKFIPILCFGRTNTRSFWLFLSSNCATSIKWPIVLYKFWTRWSSCWINRHWLIDSAFYFALTSDDRQRQQDDEQSAWCDGTPCGGLSLRFRRGAATKANQPLLSSADDFLTTKRMNDQELEACASCVLLAGPIQAMKILHWKI